MNSIHHNDIATLAILATATSCFTAFCWGVKSHFRRTEKIPPGTKLISILSLAGFISFCVQLLISNHAEFWAFGYSLFVLSAALFAWTILSTQRSRPTLAFDDDAPTFLLAHGPYRYVRHPFYLSYLVFWTGTAAAVSSPLQWLAPTVMLLVYHQAASREEVKFAASTLASAYESYRLRAGMFLPRLPQVRLMQRA